MRDALNELQDVLSTAIADIRRAIFALQPLDLEVMDFFPALTQLVEDFGEQHQYAARLDATGLPHSLPSIYEMPLFRIIQESLNNIAKYARASSVLVRLVVQTDGSVAAWVQDNGSGFNTDQLTPANHNRHFGLSQMRERIMRLGGTLVINSSVGQGTEIVINLPPIAKEGYHASD